MKLFDSATSDEVFTDQCAELVMDTMPLLMRTIRRAMFCQRPEELSVPQFRALDHLVRHAGMSLSDLAAHLGLTLPSASKLVDGLVKHDLATRDVSVDDRRKVVLLPTVHGEATLRAVREATRTRLSARLAAASPEERATVTAAIEVLKRVLLGEHTSRQAE